MPEKTEQIKQAVLDFQAGNDPSGNFALIYRLYYREVYSFFKARGKFDKDVCEDLTQTVFLNVYKGLMGFRGDSSFHTWLMRIAQHVYVDAFRKRKYDGRDISLDHSTAASDGEERGLDFPDPSPEARPLDALLEKEDHRRLEEAIMGLPERMRDCMILRIYQELSYDDIALVLRISVNTVKAQLHNGMKRIIAELGTRS